MIDLRCGDAPEIIRTLPDAYVDSVVTSPPYAMQRVVQYGGVPESLYPEWTVAWMEALRPVLKPQASVLVNIREHVRDGEMSDYVHRTRLAVRAAGWIECEELIWMKKSGPPVGHPKRPRRSWERILWFANDRRPWCDPKANGQESQRIGMRNGADGPTRGWAAGLTDTQWAGRSRCPDYIEVSPRKVPNGIHHPAVFPVQVAEWIIRLVTPPGGVVLDPFMGSGTTGVAAARLGYDFIGIDRDPTYVDLARERIRAERPPLDAAA